MNVVSPHRDDAAFSLALLVDFLLASGCPVRVINCYTQSHYAPCSDANGKDAVREIRKREDDQFFDALACRPMQADLDRLDAPLRLQCPPDATCVRRAFTEPDQQEISALSRELECTAPAGALLLPLALGNHIDHRIVREAGCGFLEGRLVGFYEEQPYAVWTHTEAIKAVISNISSKLRRGLHPFVVRVPKAVPKKRLLIDAYRSQMPAPQLDLIAEQATKYGGGERVWVDTELHTALSALSTLSGGT